jgi:hypothetical protein
MENVFCGVLVGGFAVSKRVGMDLQGKKRQANYYPYFSISSFPEKTLFSTYYLY